MVYQVILSPSAKRDLREIVRYISTDNPTAAANFGRLLVSSTKNFGKFPDMGREVTEFAQATVREIIVRAYRVVYRVRHKEKRIEVIRFWHAACDVPRL
jgi:toxin ParE1/3/4